VTLAYSSQHLLHILSYTKASLLLFLVDQENNQMTLKDSLADITDSDVDFHGGKETLKPVT
jgi:hypothetical protein